MRKITDFIVRLRYLFLVLFIILGIFCLYLSTKVAINEDIMKYLPKTSETKIGKDIMDKEFSKQDTAVLNVMFKDLSEEEKSTTLNKLESITGVSSVLYDNTSLYNQDKYTLYVLNVDDYADSKISTDVYNYVVNNFKPVGLSGSIYDENKPILQLWIVILAIAWAMIILIILSESYLEPWLYLISIGIAIFINKGTNIMFSSVSAITNSIVAILQLALSMDYSIMLSNRYKQEKENHAKKTDAMKEALYQSFKAISSSSITTIVGLIALVFMSFTIGKDLGLVLAKGVLLSLISIFFCLPALLLLFDNLIAKTKKKTIKINLTKLGKFTYKMRYVEAILIVIIFIVAYIFKGNINILYTGSEQDKVGKVFQANNQLAIVYHNNYENMMANYCKELENEEKITDVLCYANTINEKLNFNELNNKLALMGQNIEIEDYLIKLIYYKYYNPEENNKMTLNQFISFIKKEVKESAFSQTLTSEIKDNLNLLENFTNSSLLNQKRSSKEIAKIFEMKENDVNNILTYYNSNNLDITLSLKDFVNFMLNDVLKNAEYASQIGDSTILKLQKLKDFTDESIINKPLTFQELANMFGIDEKLIQDLLFLNDAKNESTTKLTFNEFANFSLNLAEDETYQAYLDTDTKQLLTKLQLLSNETIVNKDVNITTMKNYLNNLGLNITDKALNLLYVYYVGSNTQTKLSIKEFSTTALLMAQDEIYQSFFDERTKMLLEMLAKISDTNTYSVSDIATSLGQDKTLVSVVFGVFDQGTNKNISLKNLINFLSTNKDNSLLKPYLQDNLATLDLAYLIISNLKTNYNYQELSAILNIDAAKVKLIYTLYDNNHHIQTMSPLALVDFILNNKDNELLKPNLSNQILNELNLLKEVMTSTLNNTKYSASKLSSLFNLPIDTCKLLYSLYNTQYLKNNQTISLANYVNFLVKEIMPNPEYTNKFTNAQKLKITTINNIITDSLNKTKYSKDKTYSTLSNLTPNLDKSLIDLVYLYYGSIKEYDLTYQMTIEEFVNYLNTHIITDSRFNDFLDKEKRTEIIDAKTLLNKSKNLIVSDNYSRIVLNTKYAFENKETFNFVNNIHKKLGNLSDVYVVGDSPMAVEISKTFNNELNKITILTMIFIFIVVAFTFKDLIIPLVLVLIIETAVYLTMSAISLTGGSVYFISLLIVQAILMGATIDYAIVYTSYYKESRITMGIKDAVINAYNRSIMTIISSSSILIIVTLIVANFASAIAAKICETISYGTFVSTILILFILPGVLASTDKLICRKGSFKEPKVK